MSNRRFWTTPEFKKLQAQWDKKLASSGFVDIEKPDGSLTDGRFRTQQKAAYYEEVSHHLWHSEFDSPKHRKIWGLHAEGLTYKQIAKRVRISFQGCQAIVKKYLKRFKCLSPQVEIHPLIEAKNLNSEVRHES